MCNKIHTSNRLLGSNVGQASATNLIMSESYFYHCFWQYLALAKF